ncbi:sulfotransferase 1C4-like [Penaeus japonicus]|uniref:sulfotransferase 1C4-like n=1 Tax=Penaeus japonicus TaxID=27405 RepID=UPI001C7133B9|nr:sulfotransferase 1C4-like [Penaeus japonicus]
MTTLASGHKASLLEGDEWTKLLEYFPNYKDGITRLSPGGWVFTKPYINFADRFYNFEFRKDDVLVMTWPKCGTTWTQEIVWTMRNNPDLDHPDADVAIMDRVPFMEGDIFSPGEDSTEAEQMPVSEMFKRLCPNADPRKGMSLQLAKALLDPRTLKTHLPFSLFAPSLLEKTKVVYVARNPKDTVLSYQHHHKLFKAQSFVGSLETFVDYFLEDKLVYGPYWLHLKEAWERRDHPNLHFVFYEDLKADIMSELKRLDAFLGTGLSHDQLVNVAKHTSFGEMKSRNNLFINKDMFKNEAIVNQDVLQKDGGFFRQGKSGDWKAKLTPELIEKMDKWIRQKCDFGISFK